jgi:hypothetical protein
VKTQNQFPRFQFWRFSTNKFTQNRTTGEILALSCAEIVVGMSFHTASVARKQAPDKHGLRGVKKAGGERHGSSAGAMSSR